MRATPALPPGPRIALAWADRYEHLRQRGLEVGSRLCEGAQGLVLFLRQGMMSWMSELAAETSKPPARSSPPRRGATVDEDCVEIMWMLASMVGSAVEEVHR